MGIKKNRDGAGRLLQGQHSTEDAMPDSRLYSFLGVRRKRNDRNFQVPVKYIFSINRLLWKIFTRFSRISQIYAKLLEPCHTYWRITNLPEYTTSGESVIPFDRADSWKKVRRSAEFSRKIGGPV